MSNFRHTISPVGGRGVSDRKQFQNCFKVVSAVVQLLHVTKCNNMFLSEEIRRYEGNVYLIFAVFFFVWLRCKSTVVKGFIYNWGQLSSINDRLKN